MTVSEVGLIAMGSSRSLVPLQVEDTGSETGQTRRDLDLFVPTHALVTQATSGAKPSMWSFSFSSRALDTNMGK